MKGKQWAVSIILTCIIAGFVLAQLGFFDKSLSNTKEKEIIKEKIKEEIEKNAKYPDKEKIFVKILNSIDNFNTLEGEYEVYDREINQVFNTKYTIDVKNKKSIGIFSTDNKVETTVIYFENQNKKLVFDEVNRTFQEFELPPKPKEEDEGQSLAEYIYGKEHAEEYIGVAYNIVNSEYSAYLRRFEDWEFQEVTFLGLSSYKITGVIDQQLSEDLSGNFEMVVEKNTGIILDFRVFDEKNEIKYSLTTKSININIEVDEKIFEKDTSQYKKEKPFNIDGKF